MNAAMNVSIKLAWRTVRSSLAGVAPAVALAVVLVASTAFGQETPMVVDTATPDLGNGTPALSTPTPVATELPTEIPIATPTPPPSPTPTDRALKLPGRCTIRSIGLRGIDAGVIGSVNPRIDLTPDLVFADKGGGAISIALLDSVALKRADCERAATTMTIQVPGPEDVDLVFADMDSNIDFAVPSVDRSRLFFGDGQGGSAGGTGQDILVQDGRKIAGADLNADGVDDAVLIGTLGGSNVEIVSFGELGPSFEPLDVGAAVAGIEVADFTGDGLPDVLVMENSALILYVRNDVPAELPTPARTPAPAVPPNLFLPGVDKFRVNLAEDDALQIAAVVVADEVGDFNDDGIPDVAIAGRRPAGGGRLVVFLGQRGGSDGYDLVQQSELETEGNGGRPSDLAIGDFVGDISLDIVVADAALNQIQIFEGDGAGGFRAADLNEDGAANANDVIATGRGPSVVLVADVDADFADDIAVGNEADGSVNMYLTNLFPIASFTPTKTNTPTVPPTATLSPSSTPSSTPTSTPSSTVTPTFTRTLSPTITTTPGLFELRGQGCDVGSAAGAGSVAWQFLALALVLVGVRSRAGRGKRSAKSCDR